MRRIGLLLLVLTLVSLSTAAAASFSVQTDNITSFEMDVTISVPSTTAPPVQFTEMRLVGLPEVASLVLPPAVDTDPKTKTAKFQPNAQAVDVESGTPANPAGGRVNYVTWVSDTFASGLTFAGKTLRLELDRKDAVQLTAGLFDCAPSEPRSTTAPGCRLIHTGSSTTQDLLIGPIPNTIVPEVAPGHQLRLKIVNNSGTESTIQWGFNSARLVRLVAQ